MKAFLAVVAVAVGLALMLAGALPSTARYHIEADSAAPVAIVVFFVVVSVLVSRLFGRR